MVRVSQGLERLQFGHGQLAREELAFVLARYGLSAWAEERYRPVRRQAEASHDWRNMARCLVPGRNKGLIILSDTPTIKDHAARGDGVNTDSRCPTPPAKQGHLIDWEV